MNMMTDHFLAYIPPESANEWGHNRVLNPNPGQNSVAFKNHDQWRLNISVKLINIFLNSGWRWKVKSN